MLSVSALLFATDISAQVKADQNIDKMDKVSVMIEELDLSKKQAAKIQKLTARFNAQKERLNGNYERIKTLRSSYRQQVESTLTPEQKLKFKKMQQDKRAENPSKIRKNGNHSASKRTGMDRLSRMKEKLDLTEEQYAKMQVVSNGYETRIQAAKKSGNMEEVKKLRESMQKNLEAMLTPAQKAKMNQMKMERKKAEGKKRWDAEKK